MGAKSRIVVVGSYMRDLFMGVDEFPRPGETRFGHGHFAADGGKGSNQAVQAARCGADVAMVGALGDDANGRGALDLWADEGIDTTSVVVRDRGSTGVAMVIVDSSGQNQIVIDAGTNLLLTPDDIDQAADLITGADLVVAQLEVAQPTVRRAFEIARAAGVTTLLNTAPAPSMPIDELQALTDILVANEVEAAMLSGISGELSLNSGREIAAALGVGELVVTVGGEGAYLFSSSGEAIQQAPPAVPAIVDTTGAGDAFIGAFAARWIETREPSSALSWGLAAGSLACTARGVVPALAGREAVRALAES